MSELNDFIEPNKVYELNVGRTFLPNSKSSYHQFKYDFTPASIDKNQESKVNIGNKMDVVIQVPHVEGSAQKYTQFTGNKQPATTKECILIYDTKTNEFTLERLQSNFILKRSRLEGSSKAAQIITRSITPTNEKQKKKKEDTPSSANTSMSDSKKHTPMMAKSKEAAAVVVKKESSPPAKSNLTQIKAEQDVFGDLNLSDGSDSDM